MKVYLIARPQIDWDQWSKFLCDERVSDTSESKNPDSETLCVLAGRLCYMSFGKGRKTPKEFLDNIIRSGHHSVLEHANWTVLITGISRSCSHELVRHRHFSFSQLSQRYVDHSYADMILPSAFLKDGAPTLLLGRMGLFLMEAKALYRELTELMKIEGDKNTQTTKALRTIARAVLPNATMTKIVVTGNARTFREFIQKRTIAAADPEIRELADTILQMLKADAPLLFNDLIGVADVVV